MRGATVQSGFIGAGVYWTCPVDECEWRLRQAQPTRQRYVFRDLSPEGVNEGITSAAQVSMAESERLIREHCEAHDVLDLLRTIQRLNQELAQVDCGIRPHIYRGE